MMDEQQRQLIEELLFSEKKTLSFAKKLYFGIFDSSKVFPYPTVSLQEQPILDDLFKNVKDFTDKELDPDWIDRHAEIPQKIISGLGQLGILGMNVAKEHGGLGMSLQAYCKIVEMISGRCSSTALLINAHQSIGLRALILFGTDQQKERWLTPLARGEQISAFSLTEPNAGSDASGVETYAEFDPIKNVYRINGRKQWTTNGSIASVLTVMAKTPVKTHKGIEDKVTAFLVTPDMPGFKIAVPALEKVGMRGTRTTNLEFTNMEVPAENVLGPLGGGLKVCLTVLDYGRTTFGAMCTGAAKFLRNKALHHARNRYQFKRQLSSFPLVKKKLANTEALIFAMESATYLTAGIIDQGHDDIMIESALLKVFASEALWSIIYDSMQILGGRSFFTDCPFERMMRDARLNMIGEGSNEVMRAFIGAVGMRDVGMELKALMDSLIHPIAERKIILTLLPKMLKRLSLPKIEVKSSSLKNEAHQLAKAVRRFGFSIVRLLAHYREDIVERQLELERIADSAIAIYTATAVLSRLDSIAHTSHELASGKLYCKMAFATIESNLSALFNLDDQDIEALADDMKEQGE